MVQYRQGVFKQNSKTANRVARILTISNYETRSSILLDDLDWESLENKRLKQMATTMYKIHNNLSPSYLRRIFTKTSNLHEHSLRNSEINCYVPNPRTDYGKGNLRYRGFVLWNKIPSEIRNLSSLKQLKPSLNGKAYF